MRRQVLLVIVLFIVLAFSAAYAQEESNDSEDNTPQITADELVVTASRHRASWRDAPVMVTVITKQELQNSTAVTLDEFLQRVPGVAIKRTHIAECGPGREITLRGMPEQKRTLILLNGIPMNDAFGGSVNWSLIPKEMVERIEIVRGPMSALYGSGAMGGVINIITRVPARPNETTITGSYGSLDTYSGSVHQGGMFAENGYYVSGRLFDTDGYMKVEDPEDYHVKNERSDWSLMGNYYHAIDEESLLTFSIYSVDEDFNRGRLFDNQHNMLTGGFLRYERSTFDGINLTGSIYGNIMYREVEVGMPPTYDALEHTEADDIYRVGELISASFPVGRFNTITVGIDSMYNEFKKNNDYEPVETTTGEGEDAETVITEREGEAKGKQYLISLFAQDEITFVNDVHRFIFTVGGRGDYCRSYDGSMYDTNAGPAPVTDEDYADKIWLSFNPKVGFVYRYDDLTTVRLSAGRAFASPTLSELYMVFTRGPIVLNGNPELEPETAISFNLGVDQWFMKNFLMRVDGYYTQGENFISSRTIAQNTFENDNITSVQIYGVDAELRYQIVRPLATYAGYTYNQSTILEDEVAPETEDNMLAFEPRHRGRLGVTYDDPRYLTVDVSANYVGRRYTDIENTNAGELDEFVSLDVYLARMIGKHTTLALSGQNLLDKRYKVYSLPTDESFAPGLLINGTLTFAF